MDQHYEQWSTLAPRGLMIIGLGATLISHASHLKTRRKPTWQWLILGTLSLIIFNAGIAIFGEAVKHRAMYESKLGL